MGLDTVELVMAIEKHFEVRIGDKDAERADTVQQVADLVATLRPVVPSDRDVRQEVRGRLLTPADQWIEDNTPFAVLCQGRKPDEMWRRWSTSGLKMPDLPPKDRPGVGSRWFASLLPKWVRGRSIMDLSFGQVLDAIVAHNHGTLIDPLKPGSAYEILVAVIGITSDRLGVAELEIRPTDSYTNDLGAD
jgi:hypothetical protein